MTEPEVEAVARAVRRAKFESLGKMSSFDPTIAPTEGELADARAAIAHLRAAEAAAFRRGCEEMKLDVMRRIATGFYNVSCETERKGVAGYKLALINAIAALPLPEDKP